MNLALITKIHTVIKAGQVCDSNIVAKAISAWFAVIL